MSSPPLSRDLRTNQDRPLDHRDRFAGEWQVECEVSTYHDGERRSAPQDKSKSLLVVEADPDGSYELCKFPLGFGEGYPRLRLVAGNEYGGDDTIRGISILVRQSASVDKDRIVIRQTMIDAGSKQPLTETYCTGTRANSQVRVPTTDHIDSCAFSDSPVDLPSAKITRRYKSVRPFSDGLAAAAIAAPGTRSQRWGFIDKTGRTVIPMRYDVVTSFYGGLAAVGRFYGRGHNVKWGVVENLGPQVTPHLNYDAVKILGEGFAAVGYAVPGSPGLKWNLINRENTTILHGLDEIGCFVGGRARASYKEGEVVRQGYVDKSGDLFVDNK